MTTAELKAKALEEISKIKDEAVAEYLKLKADHFSGKTLLIVAGAALVLGAILGHVL